MKKWMILILVLATMGPLAVAAREKGAERIAVASDGKTITGPVGFRMGRRSFYLLFDSQGKGDNMH